MVLGCRFLQEVRDIPLACSFPIRSVACKLVSVIADMDPIKD
jgi:hypothetical protein